MKKVFLAVLCAGLFFACGNKKQAEPETLIDTPVVSDVIEAVDTVVEDVAQVVEPEAPAKKTTTNTNAKKTNPNTGMTAAKKSTEAPTVQEHAQSAANRVANKAIDKAESETTNAIVNSGKKKR